MTTYLERVSSIVINEIRSAYWFRSVPYQSVMNSPGQRPIVENLLRLLEEHKRIYIPHDVSKMVDEVDGESYYVPKEIFRLSKRRDVAKQRDEIRELARREKMYRYVCEPEANKVLSFLDIYFLWELGRNSKRFRENPYKPVMEILRTGAIPKRIEYIPGYAPDSIVVNFVVDIPITYIHLGDLELQQALLCFGAAEKVPLKRIHKWGEECRKKVATDPYEVDAMKLSKPSGRRKIIFPVPSQV